MADTIAGIANSVVSATGTAPSAASGVPTTSAANKATIAQNFDTFLKLLTTQLKNQNPLEPLDTNQFTQQLVQFAGVEQQINMNQQLTTLVNLQKATQTNTAMSFLGATATVAVSTEVKGTVDSIDLTQTPPTLKIGGQSFTLDKIKQVVRAGI